MGGRRERSDSGESSGSKSAKVERGKKRRVDSRDAPNLRRNSEQRTRKRSSSRSDKRDKRDTRDKRSRSPINSYSRRSRTRDRGRSGGAKSRGNHNREQLGNHRGRSRGCSRTKSGNKTGNKTGRWKPHRPPPHMKMNDSRERRRGHLSTHEKQEARLDTCRPLATGKEFSSFPMNRTGPISALSSPPRELDTQPSEARSPQSPGASTEAFLRPKPRANQPMQIQDFLAKTNTSYAANATSSSFPATSSSFPATSSSFPATSSSLPATSSSLPATSSSDSLPATADAGVASPSFSGGDTPPDVYSLSESESAGGNSNDNSNLVETDLNPLGESSDDCDADKKSSNNTNNSEDDDVQLDDALESMLDLDLLAGKDSKERLPALLLSPGKAKRKRALAWKLVQREEEEEDSEDRELMKQEETFKRQQKEAEEMEEMTRQKTSFVNINSNRSSAKGQQLVGPFDDNPSEVGDDTRDFGVGGGMMFDAGDENNTNIANGNDAANADSLDGTAFSANADGMDGGDVASEGPNGLNRSPGSGGMNHVGKRKKPRRRVIRSSDEESDGSGADDDRNSTFGTMSGPSVPDDSRDLFGDMHAGAWGVGGTTGVGGVEQEFGNSETNSGKAASMSDLDEGDREFAEENPGEEIQANLNANAGSGDDKFNNLDGNGGNSGNSNDAGSDGNEINGDANDLDANGNEDGGNAAGEGKAKRWNIGMTLQYESKSWIYVSQKGQWRVCATLDPNATVDPTNARKRVEAAGKTYVVAEIQKPKFDKKVGAPARGRATLPERKLGLQIKDAWEIEKKNLKKDDASNPNGSKSSSNLGSQGSRNTNTQTAKAEKSENIEKKVSGEANVRAAEKSSSSSNPSTGTNENFEEDWNEGGWNDGEWGEGGWGGDTEEGKSKMESAAEAKRTESKKTESERKTVKQAETKSLAELLLQLRAEDREREERWREEERRREERRREEDRERDARLLAMIQQVNSSNNPNPSPTAASPSSIRANPSSNYPNSFPSTGNLSTSTSSTDHPMSSSSSRNNSNSLTLFDANDVGRDDAALSLLNPVQNFVAEAAFQDDGGYLGRFGGLIYCSLCSKLCASAEYAEHCHYKEHKDGLRSYMNDPTKRKEYQTDAESWFRAKQRQYVEQTARFPDHRGQSGGFGTGGA